MKKLMFSLLAAITVIAEAAEERLANVAVLNFQNTSRHRETVWADNPAVVPSPLPLIGTKPDGSLALGSKRPADRYSEKARSLLDNALSKIPGLRLVERQHVDAIEAEYERNRSLGGRRGIAERPSRIHGADFLVFGKILDIWSETNQFQGYGITTKSEITSAQIYLRVILMSEDREVFSTEKSASFALMTTPFGSETHSDPYGEAVAAAVRAIVAEPEFGESFRRNLAQHVKAAPLAEGIEISFQSKPSEARLDVDGVYVGQTPLKRRFLPGTVYVVRLTKPGFLQWEAKINPELGLVIAAELEKTKVEKDLP